MTKRLKFWGWDCEDDVVPEREIRWMESTWAARLMEDYRAVKAAASDAIVAGGGTIMHHHAVGREHRPWYDRQRPQLFAEALKAAKKSLDPKWPLNPGVLIDLETR